MIIKIDVPDNTKCLNVCIVYGTEWTLSMASLMRPTDELRDGAMFTIPARSEDLEAQKARRDDI